MARRRGGSKGPPIWVILIVLAALLGGERLFGLLALGAVVVLAVLAVMVFLLVKAAGGKDSQPDAQRSRSGADAARSANQTARRSESGQTPQTAYRTEASQPQRPQQQVQQPAAPQHRKPKYPPEVQAVVDEGEKAHKELQRLYISIPDLPVKHKIQDIIDVSDKIVADAVADPSDVPQIKKFLDYYLPTTIKLLNSYDRMGAQGIEGENITKTMNSINEMLDTAIEAYKRLLDSLFADQAMDVETDIQVMNTLLKREGLSGSSAFQMMEK